MVGKLSDNVKISGSRIPVIYMWWYFQPHPYSTPNAELQKSIDAKNGDFESHDIGEMGVVGNLLEPVLLRSACEELGLPEPELSPPVIKTEHFECSLDGIVHLTEPTLLRTGGITTVKNFDEIAVSGPLPIEVKVTGASPTDDPPLYRGPVQLQAQMLASGASAGVLVTLHKGNERRIVVYPSDPDTQQEIVNMCRDFNRRVEAADYYPPVNIDDAVIPPGRELEQPVQLDELQNDIYTMELLKHDRDDLNARIDSIQLKIMERMGEATRATAGPYTLHWPVRNYRATKERIVPAKAARSVRLKTIKVNDTMGG